MVNVGPNAHVFIRIYERVHRHSREKKNVPHHLIKFEGFAAVPLTQKSRFCDTVPARQLELL